MAAKEFTLQVTLLDQALVSGSNFLLGVLLTRQLGLEGYGVYVLAWVVVAFFSGVQQSLVVSPLMTLLPQRPEAERAGYADALFFQQLAFALVATLLTVAAGLVAAPRLDAGTVALLPALAVALPAFLQQDYLRRLHFTRGRAGVALQADLVAYGGQIVALALAARSGGLTAAGALWSIAATFSLSAAYALARAGLPRWSLEGAARAARESWAFSKWLTASSLTSWATGNLFTVAAGAVLGAGAAGAVRASQNIVGATHVLFLALENYLPARAARLLHEDGREAMLSFVRGVATRAGALTAGVVALLVLFPATWLRLLYGPELAGYAFVLRWFALLYLLVFAGTMLRHLLRTLQETRPFFVSAAAGAALTTLLAVPMVESLGLRGVMIGLTAIQLANVVYFAACLRRVLHANRPLAAG